MHDQLPRPEANEAPEPPAEGLEPDMVLVAPTTAEQEDAVNQQFLALATMPPEEASVSRVAELGGMSHAEARDFVDERGGLSGVRMFARNELKGTDLESAANEPVASRETAPAAPAAKANPLAEVEPDALAKLAGMTHGDFSRSAVRELTGMPLKDVDAYLTKAGGLTGVKADAVEQIKADEAALEEAVAPYRDRVKAEALAANAPELAPMPEVVAPGAPVDTAAEYEARVNERMSKSRLPAGNARDMLEKNTRDAVLAELNAETAAAAAAADAKLAAEVAEVAEANKAAQAAAEQAAQEAADQAAEARKAYIRENGGVRKLDEIDARDEERARVVAWRDHIPKNADGKPTDRKPRGEARGNGIYVNDQTAPRDPETPEEWRERMGVGSGRRETADTPAPFTGGALDGRLPLEREIAARLAAADSGAAPETPPRGTPVEGGGTTASGEGPAPRSREDILADAATAAGAADRTLVGGSGVGNLNAILDAPRPAGDNPERRGGRRWTRGLAAGVAAVAAVGLAVSAPRSADEGPERNAASLAQLDRDGRTIASPTVTPSSESTTGHSGDDHREPAPAPTRETVTSSVTSADDPTRITLSEGDTVWGELEEYGQKNGVENATRDNREFMAAVNEASQATLEANNLTPDKARRMHVGAQVRRVLGDKLKQLIRLGNTDTRNMR